MRIAFVVNDVMTEEPGYTTTRLSMTAINLGHEAWTLGVGDFVYDPCGAILAHARTVKKENYRSTNAYLKDLQGDDARLERINADGIDALLLRNDPAEDAAEQPWAQTSGILFGLLAAKRGSIVLNDPANLATAINKTYFQQFPEGVRPRTCISRDAKEIRDFVDSQKGKAVLKPLQGSGGQNVFLIRPKDKANVNQMIEAVVRDGYAIVQEYLPAAAEGDIRLFVMNGNALKHKGKYAAFKRVSENGDLRNNLHAGGKIQRADVDESTLQLVEMVRPKLISDGMFLVGLDVVKDKLMEINVFSPGGLGSAQQVTDVDFCEAIIEALERKVHYKACYNADISNVQIATL